MKAFGMTYAEGGRRFEQVAKRVVAADGLCAPCASFPNGKTFVGAIEKLRGPR
jgi:hypothetical protein